MKVTCRDIRRSRNARASQHDDVLRADDRVADSVLNCIGRLCIDSQHTVGAGGGLARPQDARPKASKHKTREMGSFTFYMPHSQPESSESMSSLLRSDLLRAAPSFLPLEALDFVTGTLSRAFEIEETDFFARVRSPVSDRVWPAEDEGMDSSSSEDADSMIWRLLLRLGC